MRKRIHLFNPGQNRLVAVLNMYTCGIFGYFEDLYKRLQVCRRKAAVLIGGTWISARQLMPHDILISSLALHGINRSPIVRIKKCLTDKFQNIAF